MFRKLFFTSFKHKMDELLNKPVSQLSEEEKKKLVKHLTAAKPSVPFSSATLEDCLRSDGLALDLRFIKLGSMVPIVTLHIPSDIVSPIPSDFLCEHLLKVMKLFVMDNEKACRMLIDAILLEVLESETNENLSGFCEVKNDWFGTEFGYTGNVDYMLGSSNTKSVKTMDSFLLVVEAKKEWPDSAVAQVLTEAGCLLKKRLASGKNTPVFAVLTNGTLFRFFAIDVDSVVYSSNLCMLKRGEDGSYKTSSSLAKILRWFNWFMTSIKSISPRASNADLTNTEVQDSLAKLRSCFGPKQSQAKKLKTHQ